MFHIFSNCTWMMKTQWQCCKEVTLKVGSGIQYLKKKIARFRHSFCSEVISTLSYSIILSVGSAAQRLVGSITPYSSVFRHPLLFFFSRKVFRISKIHFVSYITSSSVFNPVNGQFAATLQMCWQKFWRINWNRQF